MPADLDMPLIGTTDLDEIDEIARIARARLGVDVNTHRASEQSWASSAQDPFLTTARSQPLIELVLDRTSQPAQEDA